MNFDDILLSLIARRARSGYELKKWLDIEGIFIRANADQSQIYRTLRRLEKHGLISHDVVRKGGPDSKVHSVTDAGAEHLRRLAESPYEPPARWQEADFLARISLLGPVSPPSIVSTITRELAFRRDQISRFRGRDRDDQGEPGPIEFDSLLIEQLGADMDRFGRQSMDAWIAFLEEQHTLWVARLDQGLDAEATRASSSSSSSS